MKKIVVLGSTGSIGRQTLEVIKKYPHLFKVVGLSTYKNTVLLAEQIKETKPLKVAISQEKAAHRFEQTGGETPVLTGEKEPVLSGIEGLTQLATLKEADLVVNALVGSVGLDSTLAVLKAGKILGLANKESLVAGGELLTSFLQKPLRESQASSQQPEARSRIIPIDSEHSAIFQCLQGENYQNISRIIITGSGGPFRGKKLKELEKVTVTEALKHPRWQMGKKVTIDSATLMNKGLEVIEAHFLFGIPYERIEVIIHPQSFIHSMVEFNDGSIKAQLAPPDMRLPIQYALSYPERLEEVLPSLDFSQIEELSFEKPDLDNFPCLKLALEAAKKGDTYPAVLNSANEEAVAAFLLGKISFLSIPQVIMEVLERHKPQKVTDLSVVKEVEVWARKQAQKSIGNLRKK